MIHPIDSTQILVAKEVNAALYPALSSFLSCEKSLDYLFYYRVSPLAIYNSCFLNIDLFACIRSIEKKYEIVFPEEILKSIKKIKDEIDQETLKDYPVTKPTLPRKDNLLSTCTLRAEQKIALERFFKNSKPNSLENTPFLSSGFAVLPSGAGKTLLGIKIALKSGLNTLFILPNEPLLKQWEKELLQKTDIDKTKISYTLNDPKAITLIVINHLSSSKKPLPLEKNSKIDSKMPLELDTFFDLLIIDEIHKITTTNLNLLAQFKDSVKIGLTATYYFNQELEKDLFFTIGPLIYDGMNAKNSPKFHYQLVRIPLDFVELKKYHTLNSIHEKYKMVALNNKKYEKLKEILKEIIPKKPQAKIIIFCQYLEQVNTIKKQFGLPTISSQTTTKGRLKVYEQFNQNQINVFATTSISNEGIDLPSANCIIQLSGKRGNAVEEYQRLGRLLRNPQGKEIFFYTLVTQNTIEEKYALERQAYLPKHT